MSIDNIKVKTLNVVPISSQKAHKINKKGEKLGVNRMVEGLFTYSKVILS